MENEIENYRQKYAEVKGLQEIAENQIQGIFEEVEGYKDKIGELERQIEKYKTDEKDYSEIVKKLFLANQKINELKSLVSYDISIISKSKK